MPRLALASEGTETSLLNYGTNYDTDHGDFRYECLNSALRSRRGASFALLKLVGDSRWRLHLSTALALEYEAIARREARHFWLNPGRVEDVLSYIFANCAETDVSFKWRPALPDPDDDFILELAVAARARYIVTHNVRNFAGAERFQIGVTTPAKMLFLLEQNK